ncbi:MAG: Amidohydrolase 2 [Verrucomicrobiales bacterium]|nr:Amidohydrolase 2 [Verrucomicrobiales bacterium]
MHIVGNGSSGSGCWLRIGGWHKALAAFMCRSIGLPLSAITGDFDQLYVKRLLLLVRESSLSAAVILAHEQVYQEDGKVMEGKGSFYVPNDYVLQLAKKHPEFLPAVSIHPARPDALEELEKCLEAGAAMMKCLPNCQNIDCSNRRYQKFWERMAEAGLPLLAHTGGEHTVPVVRKEYSDPRILTLPLECGVKVIAAHCGTKSGLTDPDYFNTFVGMTQRFPNLFGDSSAFNVPIRGRHVPECVRESLASRVLHGSDFPVPVLGHWGWLQGFLSWTEFRHAQATGNLLERDYRLKKAMGFPKESFTRVWEILRLSTAKAGKRFEK